MVTERKLYWADGRLGRIEGVRVDGSGRQLVYSRPGDQYHGLALSACFLYVTDRTRRYGSCSRLPPCCSKKMTMTTN